VMLLGFGVFLAIYLRGGAEVEGDEEEDRPRAAKKLSKKSMKR
jgi:hypothetical protein